MAAGRLHRQALVGVDRLRKVAVPEVEEPDRGAIGLIDGDSDFRWFQRAEILVLEAFEVFQQPFQAVILFRRTHHASVGRNLDPIQHVGVEDAGLRHGSKREGNDDLFATIEVVAGKPENVVEVGGADVDVRKNRIDGVGIVVVGHRDVPAFGVATHRVLTRDGGRLASVSHDARYNLK